MGSTLQFAIGNKTKIISAVEKEDFDFFEMLEAESKISIAKRSTRN